MFIIKFLSRILFSLFLISLLPSQPAMAKTYKIAALMWHETPHDEEALQGFIEGLNFIDFPHEVDVKRAGGDENKSRAYLRAWRQEKVDLIFTTSTVGTQWALEEIKEIPIIFSAVTHPVLNKIADSWESSGRNITGSSNWIKIYDMLELFQKLVPGLKNLGVIYSKDNPVPVAEVKEARDACRQKHLTLKEKTITEPWEVENAIADLSKAGIDALWVPREKLLYQHMEYLVKHTIPKKIPVVSSTLEAITLVEGGGIIAVTVDYRRLGRLCVQMALDILLTGVAPKDIPIRIPDRYNIVLNMDAANQIGYRIPPDFLAKADTILRTNYSGQKIVIAGTGDSQYLIKKLAHELTRQLGDVTIEVPDSIGSTGGIKALLEGTADMARTARGLKEEEIKKNLNEKIFALSPIVFVVHPDTSAINNLTFDQIVDIYSGKITNWEQLEGQNAKIYPVTRESGDSSLQVLNANIPGFNKIENPVAKVVYSTPKSVTLLEDHPKTIGFLPRSAVDIKKMKPLTINGHGPTEENIKGGKYPLVTPFVLMYKDEAAPLAKKFLQFLSSPQAKGIMLENGAIPVD